MVDARIHPDSIHGKSQPKGSVFKTAADENTLYYAGSKRYEVAKQLKAETERLIHELRNGRMGHVATPASVADEIAKLANLRDQGILNSEEFEIQKKRLLDQATRE